MTNISVDKKLYRYTSNGEGVFSAGKRLLPENLVEEAKEARKWIPRPELPEGNYRFYLTQKGKKQYKQTLLIVHQKYLSNIECEEINRASIDEVIYEDEWQIVSKKDIFKGAIIEESLEDASVLKKFKILETIITKDENPADRWHIHNVEATREQLESLSKVIKPTKYYAHFWNKNREVIAVFRGKMFTFKYDDKSSWKSAIEHGLSVGIPLEQLDFLI